MAQQSNCEKKKLWHRRVSARKKIMAQQGKCAKKKIYGTAV